MLQLWLCLQGLDLFLVSVFCVTHRRMNPVAKLLHDLQIAGSTSDGAIQGYFIGNVCSNSRGGGSFGTSNTVGARPQQLLYFLEHRVTVQHKLQL